MSQQVGLDAAFAKACQMLGEAQVLAALTAEATAALLAEKDAETERLTGERDELLHQADRAPDR